MSPRVHPGDPRKSEPQAGSFSTRSRAGRHDRTAATRLCHRAVQKWRDVERQRGGDEEAIRRWERPLMRDRQAGEIRSGE